MLSWVHGLDFSDLSEPVRPGDLVPTPALRALRAFRRRRERRRRERYWAREIRAGRLVMGRHTYGSFRIIAHSGDQGRVEIGSFCSIADGTEFLIGGNHPPEWPSTYPFRAMMSLPGAFRDGLPASKGPIVVGNDVWIGRNSLIMSGVKIGNGAIIGAGSVVAKDVRPYAIVVGNPASEVRRRFTDAQVARLERIRWWDWPLDVILENVRLLNAGDVDRFLTAAEEFSDATGADPKLAAEYVQRLSDVDAVVAVSARDDAHVG